MQNELIRGFAINREEKFENYKFSVDSKYLARLKKDILIVYTTPSDIVPTMEMLADAQGVRQPIKDGIKEIHWFPNRNNILAISVKMAGKKVSESILQFFEVKFNLNLRYLREKLTNRPPYQVLKLYHLNGIRTIQS
jgi:uncharacterized protein with WD repeat